MNPSSDFRNSESTYRSGKYFSNTIGIRRELHLDRYKESLQTREPGLLAAAGTTQEEPPGFVQKDTVLSSGRMKRVRGQELN
jgi:hypothetical protein